MEDFLYMPVELQGQRTGSALGAILAAAVLVAVSGGVASAWLLLAKVTG